MISLNIFYGERGRGLLEFTLFETSIPSNKFLKKNI